MKLINPEVRIENTNACNASCIICPREKMTRPKAFMDQAHFENLVDQAKDLGATLISVFGYGEPLLDKGILNKIQYCTDQGLETFITTNASLLNLNMAYKLLDAGLSQIRFSVHGLAIYYRAVHRGLEYKDVIRNIANFAAINRQDKIGCRTQVSVIPLNNEPIDLIKSAWDGFELEIWEPHNWTDGRNYRVVKKDKKTCGRPHRGPVQINADGKMMVCCFDFDAKLTVGDTYKNTIKEILKSDAFNSIREKHETGDLKGLICDTCDQLTDYNALIYSNIDPDCKMDTTSSAKFALCEECI